MYSFSFGFNFYKQIHMSVAKKLFENTWVKTVYEDVTSQVFIYLMETLLSYARVFIFKIIVI